MFERYALTSGTDLGRTVLEFLQQTSTPYAERNLRFIMKGGQTVEIYMADADEVDSKGNDPVTLDSTIGLSLTYTALASRYETNKTATATSRASQISAIYRNYLNNFTLAQSVHQMKEYYEAYRTSYMQIMQNYVLSTVSHVLDGDNAFHVGGSLSWDDVPFDDSSIKYLDCHYNNGVFGFFLWQNKEPYITKSLIFGEITEPAHSGNKYRGFIASNAVAISSQESYLRLSAVIPNGQDVTVTIPAYSTTINTQANLVVLHRNYIDAENLQGVTHVKDEEKPFAINMSDFRMSTRNRTFATSSSSPSITGYSFRRLYTSLDLDVADKVPTYQPLTSQNKISVEYYDDLSRSIRTLTARARTGTGGNSVNQKNPLSTVMPLILYGKRDPDISDSYSYLGMVPEVNFINMYNIGTGRIYGDNEEGFDSSGYACYNIWKRRKNEYLFSRYWRENSESTRKWTEIIGYGSYMGIAFKLDRTS